MAGTLRWHRGEVGEQGSGDIPVSSGGMSIPVYLSPILSTNVYSQVKRVIFDVSISLSPQTWSPPLDYNWAARCYSVAYVALFAQGTNWPTPIGLPSYNTFGFRKLRYRWIPPDSLHPYGTATWELPIELDIATARTIATVGPSCNLYFGGYFASWDQVGSGAFNATDWVYHATYGYLTEDA